MNRRTASLAACLGIALANTTPALPAAAADATLAGAIAEHRAIVQEAEALVGASGEAPKVTEAIDAQQAVLEEQGLLGDAAPGGAPGDAKSFDRIGRHIAAGSQEFIVKTQWENALKRAGKDADVDALIRYVMRASHVDAARDLRRRVAAVKNRDEQKQELAAKLAKLREAKAPAEEGAPDPKQEVDALEAKLAAATEQSERANARLKEALEKQQKALQAMKGVSKMLADSAKATIQKIGG